MINLLIRFCYRYKNRIVLAYQNKVEIKALNEITKNNHNDL